MWSAIKVPSYQTLRPVENGADTRGVTDRWTNGRTDTQTVRKSRSQWALFTNITTRLKMAQIIKPKHVAEVYRRFRIIADSV